MADFCYYEIHVKGSKKACYAYFSTTPAIDEQEIIYETETEEDYILHYKGVCKWSLDYYCNDDYTKEVDLTNIELEEIKESFDLLGLNNITPQTKSMALNVIAEVYTYSEEGNYKCFYRYDLGETVFEEEDFEWDYLEENDEEEFIWDKDEYVNFEDFLEEYGLIDSDIKEEDFKPFYDNVYIKPANSYETSSNFTF